MLAQYVLSLDEVCNKQCKSEEAYSFVKSKEIRHVILTLILHIYPLVGGICMLVLYGKHRHHAPTVYN